MLTFPVKVYSAIDEQDLSFNQLHPRCHQRVRQLLHCPTCEAEDEVMLVEVQRNEVEKGYPVGDSFIVVSEEDFKRVPVPSQKTVEVVEFVDRELIDPRHWEKSYFLVPDQAGGKAFALLLQAMEESDLVAVGRFTMRQRESLVTIRPFSDGMESLPIMLLQTLFYHDELRDPAELVPQLPQLTDQERGMARQLVDALSNPAPDFNQYHDQYRESLVGIIEAKINGEELPDVADIQAPAATDDIMATLMASVEAVKAAKAA
jgi:DNA end-binding protein Ku